MTRVSSIENGRGRGDRGKNLGRQISVIDWRDMRTSRRVAALAAACVWLFAPGAWAQASLDRLITALKSGGDFRVQTQAALALGASKNQGAVAPLCGALSDPNTTVRAAAAAALGKLALGG